MVPNLSGMAYAKACALLNELGISYRPAEADPALVVDGTMPETGAILSSGQPVNLFPETEQG